MCGGFALYDYTEFDARFKIPPPRPASKSYNIRPSMETPAIYANNGTRTLDNMRFGMVPVWAKDEKIGFKLFNARSETLFQKPAWKRSAKSKRCIIPANAFYEWQKQSDGKHPLLIHPSDQTLFSFAGVYDHWTNPNSQEAILSFAIITTTPNKEMEPVHDRMPVILTEEKEEKWLSDEEDAGYLESILEPYPNGYIKMYEVSTLVNSARNQGKDIIEPLAS